MAMVVSALASPVQGVPGLMRTWTRIKEVIHATIASFIGTILAQGHVLLLWQRRLRFSATETCLPDDVSELGMSP